MKIHICFLICSLTIVLILNVCSDSYKKENILNEYISVDSFPVITDDPIIEIPSFISNTIYRSEDDETYTIDNYLYTPAKRSYDRPIYVHIKDCTAEIMIGNTITALHHIQSQKCIKYKGCKIALFQTDKGEIQIIEYHQNFESRFSFCFYIKSDSLIISSLMSLLTTSNRIHYDRHN